MPKSPPRISRSIPQKTRATGKRLWSNEGKNSTQRGYGWQHQKARAQLLRDERLCRNCAKHGRVTEATIADHIIPLAETGLQAPSELQPLCRACHDEKSLSEARRGRGGQKSDGPAVLDPMAPLFSHMQLNQSGELMQRGTKPETPGTKLARGTFQPCRDAGKVEIVSSKDPPQIPDPVAIGDEEQGGDILPTLTPQARIVWHETLPRVMAVGVAEPDSAFLARYCGMEALSRETLSKGQPIPTSLMTALRQMEELLGIAGPKSRIGRKLDGQPANPFSRNGRR